MNGIRALMMFAPLFAASTASSANERPALICAGIVSAVGVSTHSEGGRDFERYAGQVPPGLARSRAIQNWQLQISNACPKYSAKWWRARQARVDCEGGQGREYCTATAEPARKLLSYLLPY